MKRKFEIPKMSNEEIAKWYTTIKPIVSSVAIPTYLRDLSQSELTDTAFIWFHKSNYAKSVDYNKLSFLADVKMLHSYGYTEIFKPTVAEVIRQIPKEHLEKVVAFEILVGPVGMSGLFKDEFNAGFHVSIVRLYQEKDSSNLAASPVTNFYPSMDCITPIGMTEKDFEALKEFAEREQYKNQ